MSHKLSAEDLAWLTEAWASKMHLKDIRARLNIADPKALERLAARHGLGKRPVTFDRWPTARTELLTKLHADGQTAREIATGLNAAEPGLRMTRSAVIGRLHRMGLPSNPAPNNVFRIQREHKKASAPKPVKAAKPTPTPAPLRIVGNRPTTDIAPQGPVTPAVDAFAPLPGSTPLPWTQRPSMACAWPVGGEGADLLSCCLPTDGGSWCAGHAKRAFSPTGPKVYVPGRVGMNRSRRRAA